MKYEIIKELINKFLKIRPIIAFILTVTFAILALKKIITPAEFMTIFSAVIIYFFMDNKNNKGEK